MRSVMGGVAAALVMAAGSAWAPEAWAQDGRKPNPPAPVSDVDTRGTERLASMTEFLDAYRRAGAPRLLFAVTTDVTSTGARGADAIDISESLAARMEDLFRDPEIIIVEPTAAALREARGVDGLLRNDEVAAARMLARDVSADVAFVVSVGERSGRMMTGRYTLVDLRAGTTLGRFAWDFVPDESTGKFGSERVSEYARSIGRRMSRQFIEAFPQGAGLGAMRRYSISIAGEYNDADLTRLRDALDSAAGVREGSTLVRGQQQSVSGQLTVIELLSSRDGLSVRDAVRRAAERELGASTEVLDLRDTQMSVRLTPLGMSERERALAGTSAWAAASEPQDQAQGGGVRGERREERREVRYEVWDGDDWREVRSVEEITERSARESAATQQPAARASVQEQFRDAYAKAGSPTFALLIGKVDTPQREPARDSGASGGSGTGSFQAQEQTNIIIGERVRVGDGGAGGLDPVLGDVIREEVRERLRERREERLTRLELDQAQVESRVAQRLLTLGLRLRDVSAAQREARLAGEMSDAGDVRSAGLLLAGKARADIALTGVTRVTRTGSGGAATVDLTLSAVRVSDGAVLASSSSTRTITSADQSVERAVEDLTAQAVGRLASQLLDAWSQGR